MPIETIVGKEKVMNPGGQTHKYNSTFPLSAPKFQTDRYGEYAAIDAWNVIARDKLNIRIPHEMRSGMLKGPLMQSMSTKHDLFFVAKQAMLPKNWEKLEITPTQGDIVPEDANTCIDKLENYIATIMSNWKEKIQDIINDEEPTEIKVLTNLIKFALFGEMFYTKGCLMNNLGKPMFRYFKNNLSTNKKHKHSYGYFFDELMKILKTYFPDGFLYTPYNGHEQKAVWSNPDEKEMSVRTMLCKMRDDFSFEVDKATEDITNWEDLITDISNVTSKIDFKVTESSEKPFNYERLLAYQIVCAHYYSNDKIDYVYTADLWRNLMFNYYTAANGVGGTQQPTFQYNGLTCTYDTLSGKIVGYILENINNYINYEQSTTVKEIFHNAVAFIRAIFQFNRSLRFMDYFTGARSKPLAVADYNVAVEDNMVSVIDITKRTLTQKLGNALNKVGNKIESQIKELLGVEMAPDYHNPFWLGHTSDSIGAAESEGTGEALFDSNARPGISASVAAFKSNSGSMQFEVTTDRKGIVIAIRYYEIPRVYVNTTNRFFFIRDKWDEYDPYMQFTGDQPIFRDELIHDADHDEYFAYCGHDMQYKQATARATGGFVEDLPGWLFIADQNRTDANLEEIGPSYIRSLQTEIDELFQSLIGYSYDTYYHFEVKQNLDVTAKRPMAYNPGILQ